MTYPCGCVNEIDAASGVLRSVSKCLGHTAAYRSPYTLDEAYYRDLGAIGDTPHAAELLEALGPFPAAFPPREALEIGCGCSHYVGAIRAAGWRYTGQDVSPFAIQWMESRWGARVLDADADWDDLGGPHGLILAAHVLEHLEDAPNAIARLACSLSPRGELWIIVPDDTDPVNPDHLWFFSEATLRRTIEAAGLTVRTLRTFKRIERENFIYCRAVKP